jgi:hypothetical protein
MYFVEAEQGRVGCEEASSRPLCLSSLSLVMKKTKCGAEPKPESCFPATALKHR